MAYKEMEGKTYMVDTEFLCTSQFTGYVAQSTEGAILVDIKEAKKRIEALEARLDDLEAQL